MPGRKNLLGELGQSAVLRAALPQIIGLIRAPNAMSQPLGAYPGYVALVMVGW